MTGEDLSRTFGSVAVEYERRRPSYPEAVVSWLTRRVPGRQAAEVGAGTGIATRLMVARGFDVTALEPDPEMVAVGRDRVPQARWLTGSAETWEPPPRAYDLVFGAQCWHWVSEEADARLARALRAGGVMAWMWNHPDRTREAEVLGDIKARYKPEEEQTRRAVLHRRDKAGWIERLAKVTVDVEVFEHTWSHRLTAEEYVALVLTYSDNIVLPEHVRVSYVAAIRRRIAEVGGSLELTYLTRVYAGCRAG